MKFLVHVPTWLSAAQLPLHAAVLAYVGFLGGELELAEVRAAAKKLGVEIVTLPVKTADEISPAFEGIHNRADALYVPSNPLANTNRVQINMLALRERLPTMHGFRILC